MKKLARRPREIETLNFHAAVEVPAAGERRLISDPARVASTVEVFRAGLLDSVGTPSRIRGWMSDQLFGLIAADLGKCSLVKQEDSGVLFHEDEVKIPDWRLTLTSGEKILVEVKIVNENEWTTARFRRAEVDKLTRYAELNACSLYIAINWAALSTWTLVSIRSITRINDHYEIDFPTAVQRNHMGSLLGDRMLGLVPPLEFRMALEPAADSEDSESPEKEEGEGQISTIVSGVRILCGGEEMEDEREKALIWFLLQHARWPVSESIVEKDDGTFELLIVMEPEEDTIIDQQNFCIIGQLSELYTRMFYVGTVDEEGTTQLLLDVEPGTLPGLVPTDLQSDRLRLWHFHLIPNEPDDSPNQAIQPVS